MNESATIRYLSRLCCLRLEHSQRYTRGQIFKNRDTAYQCFRCNNSFIRISVKNSCQIAFIVYPCRSLDTIFCTSYYKLAMIVGQDSFAKRTFQCVVVWFETFCRHKVLVSGCNIICQFFMKQTLIVSSVGRVETHHLLLYNPASATPWLRLSNRACVLEQRKYLPQCLLSKDVVMDRRVHRLIRFRKSFFVDLRISLWLLLAMSRLFLPRALCWCRAWAAALLLLWSHRRLTNAQEVTVVVFLFAISQ